MEPFLTLEESTEFHYSYKKSSFIEGKWAKLSPQMQPVDCTLSRSLAVLKIEPAAPGNESWHCKLASWPAPPNLAVDNIDAGRWAPIRSALQCWRKVATKSRFFPSQRLDCIVWFDFSFSNEHFHRQSWCSSNLGLPQVVIIVGLSAQRFAQICLVPLFYSLLPSHGNKSWLSSG